MWHVGRAFYGHYIEDECICPQQACGLVDLGDCNPDCKEHGYKHPARTMRQGHLEQDCKGADHGKA